MESHALSHSSSLVTLFRLFDQDSTSEIVSAKRDLIHAFFKISIFWYSRSLKYFLHIASYALRIGVSVM